tara:strand:- start:1474 stop:1839 length:366 start_codon:yes stop_codon:yes gene_type:complete
MATYTAEQLRLGTPIEALTAGTTYDFIVSRPHYLSGSAYLNMEQIGNSFTTSSVTNASGSYNLDAYEPGSVSGLVLSPYKAGFVVQPTPDFTSSFAFTPAENIAVSSSLLRATGGINLTIL